ncbi:MAG: type II toxin-antitoxin system VapC family toxin [Verrucomicrobiales bacterium]|nr:type II toxin-antitoxin system VapC family toxin [Verrucomicrobiales bacterium]
MTSTRHKGRYLIDTHVFLWALDSVERLSQRSREILDDRSSEILLSRTSYWEICLRISKGKLRLKPGWERTLERERKRNRFHWLEISSQHCESLISLPEIHRDPFDRMLISQATCEGVVLVSCNELMSQHEVEVLW